MLACASLTSYAPATIAALPNLKASNILLAIPGSLLPSILVNYLNRVVPVDDKLVLKSVVLALSTWPYKYPNASSHLCSISV